MRMDEKACVSGWRRSSARMNSHVHTQTGMTLRQRSRGARSRHFDACGPKQQSFSPPSRLSRRQQVICAANDVDVVRPHQRSGGDRVFASGKYGKVGSRGAWGRAPYRKRCPAASHPSHSRPSFFPNLRTESFCQKLEKCHHLPIFALDKCIKNIKSALD